MAQTAQPEGAQTPTAQRSPADQRPPADDHPTDRHPAMDTSTASRFAAARQQVAVPPRAESHGISVLDRVRALPVALVGAVLVVAGGVLQLVAIVSSTWWSATVNHREFRFGFEDLKLRTQRGLAYIYFGWGAWALLLLSVALGIAACVRWRGARPFRIAGGIVGVLGAALTIGAVVTFAHQANEGIFQIARNYSVGVYLASLGLLATAFGAAAGGAGR